MPNPDPASRPRKPIFDLVRQLMGRKFRQSEVKQLDDALDGKTARAKLSKAASYASSKGTIGAEGIALIKRFEG